MIEKEYADYAWEQAEALLGVDSPSGFTHNAAQWVLEAFRNLGYDARLTGKGGVLADLGGENSQDGLLLAAHTDTLGGMVSQVKGTGRLTITPLGGLNSNNAEAENVRVYTRDGKVLEGTFQLCNPSVHVNGAYSTTARSFDVMEVVLDEATTSKGETEALGVRHRPFHPSGAAGSYDLRGEGGSDFPGDAGGPHWLLPGDSGGRGHQGGSGDLSRRRPDLFFPEPSVPGAGEGHDGGSPGVCQADPGVAFIFDH